MSTQNVLHYVLEGSFCSFRDPVAARYQPTFWFPPKTTVVGFLGCALGLRPPELEPFYDDLKVGMRLLSYKGTARDLWGFTKLKGSNKPESAVVIRELLYRPRYAFYIAANEADTLQRIQQALLDPVYPLRFGRGEDLAMMQGPPKIISVSSVEDEDAWLEWTLIPFSLSTHRCKLGELDDSSRQRIPPRPARIPIRFRYNARSMVRDVEMKWMTQVFDWRICPDKKEGMWSDGTNIFYLI
jgi:CRISPR-associated Cas5-like protein